MLPCSVHAGAELAMRSSAIPHVTCVTFVPHNHASQQKKQIFNLLSVLSWMRGVVQRPHILACIFKSSFQSKVGIIIPAVCLKPL